MNVPTEPNDAAQLAAPCDRCAEHSVPLPDLNVTTPVGVLPDEVTVADSFTAAPTDAFDGVAITVVVVGCGGTICTRAVPEEARNRELPG